MKNSLAVAVFSYLLVLSIGSVASAGPVEYVRICDVYGAGFYYIPGTETCVDPSTGETRRETEFGTLVGETELAARVGNIEGRIAAAFRDIAISNALESPDLISGERAGIRINWGAAGSENAVGISGALVFSEKAFNNGGRLAGTASIGFSGDRVAGRVGLQLTW